MKRVETGPLQFENDWPGVFIRGDVAIGLALELEEGRPEIIRKQALRQVIALLNSCDARSVSPADLQKVTRRE